MRAQGRDAPCTTCGWGARAACGAPRSRARRTCTASARSARAPRHHVHAARPGCAGARLVVRHERARGTRCTHSAWSRARAACSARPPRGTTARGARPARSAARGAVSVHCARRAVHALLAPRGAHVPRVCAARGHAANRAMRASCAPCYATRGPCTRAPIPVVRAVVGARAAPECTVVGRARRPHEVRGVGGGKGGGGRTQVARSMPREALQCGGHPT